MGIRPSGRHCRGPEPRGVPGSACVLLRSTNLSNCRRYINKRAFLIPAAPVSIPAGTPHIALSPCPDARSSLEHAVPFARNREPGEVYKRRGDLVLKNDWFLKPVRRRMAASTVTSYLTTLRPTHGCNVKRPQNIRNGLSDAHIERCSAMEFRSSPHTLRAVPRPPFPPVCGFRATSSRAPSQSQKDDATSPKWHGLRNNAHNRGMF